MFNFSPLAAVLLAVAFVTPSMAVPVTEEAASDLSTLDKRQSQAKVKYCENIDWGGACRIHEAPFGSCQNLGDDWNDRISSIKNELGWGTTCTWYEHANCGAWGGATYSNQNDANLADGDVFFNDRISSWKCIAFL